MTEDALATIAATIAAAIIRNRASLYEPHEAVQLFEAVRHELGLAERQRETGKS